jgi:hypothetical protein
LNKLFRLGIVLFIVFISAWSTPANASVVCDTYTYSRDDDSAYPANLPFTLTLGSTEYNNVFISTNGTLTFGVADGTYGSYPQTPSVSVAGYDWVTWGEGAYLSFGSTDNTFCAEWSVRPYPQSTGELTQIRLVINRASDGGWHGEVVTFGWLPADLRRGIRYERGADVVPMEAAFDVNGGIPVEVPPAPVPSSFTDAPVVPTPVPSQTPDPEPTASVVPTLDPEPTPTLEPTQNPTPEPVPTDTVTPLPEPIPEQTPTPIPSESELVPVVPIPTPTLTPEPVPLPPVEVTQEPTPSPTPEPTVDPIPLPAPSNLEELLTSYTPEEAIPFDVLVELGIDYSELPPDQPITLENGVVITAGVAYALQIFDNTSELLGTLFTDPGKALKAISNIGADMSPQSREVSQNVVVSAIIVGQLAQIRRIK